MPKLRNNALSEKQKAFVREFLIDLNATKAAIRAGYSKRTARQLGQQNLSKPYIQEAIKAEIDSRAERTRRTADEVVELMWRMAELDLADYVRVAEGGEIQAIPFDQLPPGATRLISKVKEKRTIKEDVAGGKMVVTDGLEYELPDRVKCVEMLGRHYGLFKEKLQIELDQATLTAIIKGLPGDLADAVKLSLMSAIAKKK